MPGEYGELGDMRPLGVECPFTVMAAEEGVPSLRSIRESKALVAIDVRGACLDWGIGTCCPVR